MVSQTKSVAVIVEHPSIEYLFNHVCRTLFPDVPITPYQRRIIYRNMASVIHGALNLSQSPYWSSAEAGDALVMDILEYVRQHVNMYKVRDVVVLYNNLISFEVS